MFQGKVNEHVRLKYDSQFHAHFANHISELIYANIYTKGRVRVKDLLCYVNDQEYMIRYVEAWEMGYSEMVRCNAEYFLSPLCMGSEIPMAILTNTRRVFQERRKRLRKMMTDNEFLSYSCSKSLDSSPSSTARILQENLSQLSFNYHSSESEQSKYASTPGNIYSPPSTEIPLREESTENSVSFFRERLELRDEVQDAVKHLVLSFHQRESTVPFLTVYRSKQRQMKRKTDYQPNNPQSRSHISSEIESVVKAELKKYNIYQIMERNSINSVTSMRVRQKAQQLLRSLQNYHPI